MDVIRQHVKVAFTYPVHFTRGLFAPHDRLLRDLVQPDPSGAVPGRVLFVVDAGVIAATPGFAASLETYCAAHADALSLAGPILVLPGGEQVKNERRHLEAVEAAIHAARLCRHSYLVAIGGGAVLDVAGFAAAIAHRGIRLIRVPTTVLAQDDSGVGVKNGINGFGEKNYLGAFAPPFAVVNDLDFLSTLSDRDWRSGMSEAVKAALIRDASFFAALEADADALVARDTAAMERLVRRSAGLHLAHIASGGDPFELGSSRPLDFGHWSAHKLERLTRHELKHGEAVAIGIALDSTYAWTKGLLPKADWLRIVALLRALGFRLWVPALAGDLDVPDGPTSVLRGLEEFREHLGGRLTILLLSGIGEPIEVHEIDRSAMIDSIALLRQIDDGRATDSTRKAS
jgi:3-dehydroquinate synthase